MIGTIICIYYMFVAFFIGFIGSFSITLEGTYDIDKVLTDVKEFLRCVFMYQFFCYDFLNDEINKFGMLILQTLITFSVWWLNVLVFMVLIICMTIKAIAIAFLYLFKKKR